MTIGQNGPGSKNWPGGRLAWFQITIIDTDDLGRALRDADYSILIKMLRILRADEKVEIDKTSPCRRDVEPEFYVGEDQLDASGL